MKTPDIDGVCYVISHGSPTSVSKMNAEQLNNKITEKGCDKNQPVKIDACRTGFGKNSIAEQLSKIRGTPVTAPTKYTWTIGNYSIGIPFGKTEKGNFNILSPGKWRKFDNEK